MVVPAAAADFEAARARPAAQARRATTVEPTGFRRLTAAPSPLAAVVVPVL
jgi:hypothetical protein